MCFASPIGQLTLGLLALLILAPVSRADESAVIKSGQRVRLVCDDTRLGIFSGEIAALGRTGLTVRPNEGVDTLLQVPYNQIKKMEVCFGRRGHGHMGAAIGFAAILIPNFIWAQFNDQEKSHVKLDDDVFLMKLGCGILVGGVIGALIRSDDWRQADPKSIQIALGPHGSGPEICLSFRF